MATAFVKDVMVRLTQEQLDKLESMLRPGEQYGPALRRILCEAAPVATLVLRYRQPPLVPDWLEQGPLSPADAVGRARSFSRSGFEVGLRQAEEADYRPRRGRVGERVGSSQGDRP